MRKIGAPSGSALILLTDQIWCFLLVLLGLVSSTPVCQSRKSLLLLSNWTKVQLRLERTAERREGKKRSGLKLDDHWGLTKHGHS